MKRSNAFFLFVVLAAVAFAACSSGGGSNDASSATGTVAVSGALSTGTGGYNSFAAIKAGVNSLVPNPIVDQVVAIPMNRGSLRADSMSSRVTSSVDAGGNFSLALSKSYDWLVVLVDTSATGTNRFVGSVGIKTGETDTSGLLNLPATVAAVSSLNLGTISRPNASANDALSAATVTGSDFKMTEAQLTTMTKTDDLFKNAMNIVNNFEAYGNGTGVSYRLRPDFKWRGVYSVLTNSNNLDTQPSYTFHHYNFQLDTNSPSVTMGMLCPTNTKTLQLFPPAGTTVSASTGTTYTETVPLQNDSPVCGVYSDNTHSVQRDSDFQATDAYGGMTYGFPTDLYGDIPHGYWIWKEDGVIKGEFDNSIVIPKSATGKPTGFAPALRVNVSGNRILSVDIAWYYYDAASDQYVKLSTADLALLSHAMLNAEVSFMNEAMNTKEDIYFDPVLTTSVSPTAQVWNLDTGGGATDGSQAVSIIVFYETGGVGNYFENFGPSSP
jgi:hypothetical protein